MAEAFIGEIRTVGFNFAPRGWALCNGQLLSISQNTALFALLGTTYGGDGKTTFGLPNLGGRIALGQGQSQGTGRYNIGQMAGSEQVTLTQAQMPAHKHTLNLGDGDVNLAQPASSGNGSDEAPGPNKVPAKVLSGLNALNAYNEDTDTTLKPIKGSIGGDTEPTGANHPVDVVQPYTTVNFIIAVQGIFPSRD